MVQLFCHKAQKSDAVMDVFMKVSPFSTLFYRYSIPIAQFGLVACSGKIIENYFNLGVLRLFGTFITALHQILCLDTFLSLSTTGMSFNLMAWFLLSHALSFGRPLYKQVCAFPNQLNLLQMDSSEGGL